MDDIKEALYLWWDEVMEEVKTIAEVSRELYRKIHEVEYKEVDIRVSFRPIPVLAPIEYRRKVPVSYNVKHIRRNM